MTSLPPAAVMLQVHWLYAGTSEYPALRVSSEVGGTVTMCRVQAISRKDWSGSKLDLWVRRRRGLLLRDRQSVFGEATDLAGRCVQSSS